MARVRIANHELVATPIEQLPNGNWLMRAEQHGPRWVPGTTVWVLKKDVLEMAAAEIPAPAESQAQLEAAMAAERETITPVAELLAKAPRTAERSEG